MTSVELRESILAPEGIELHFGTASAPERIAAFGLDLAIMLGAMLILTIAMGLTVGGELNKIAANIAIGRNMAGVHWRSDYFESVRLGERVAICILFNQRKDYHEDYSFSFTSFDGDKFKITPEEVTKNGESFTEYCHD